MTDREELGRLADVLESRGRNNSLHDIQRAVATLRRLAEAGTQQPAPSVAVPSPPQDDVRVALAEIKLIALTAGAPDGLNIGRSLSRIVRLCRDAGITETMTEIAAALRGNQSDGARVPERETSWLIERVGHGQYTTSPDALPALTNDPWRACRFATEREAWEARLRLTSLRDECVVIEHMFINRAEPLLSDTTPSRPEVSVSDLLHVIALWLDDEGLNISMSQGEELARALKAKYHMEGRE